MVRYLWSYKVATPGTLRTMLEDKWQTTEAAARNLTARLDVLTIQSLRWGNNRKAQLQVAALLFQVGELIALTYAVYRILRAAN